MALPKHDTPPSESPSSTTSSLSVSPESPPIPLAAMDHGPEDQSESSSTRVRGTRGAPGTLSRSQSASKGGCWTCRLRRKKCDEQREGDSCKTCKRLTIKCLGWGSKRPEWMRDKQAVDDYKAGIKARLTQKGLIRGQPRSNPMHAPSHRPAPTTRPSSSNSVPVNMGHSDFYFGDLTFGSTSTHTGHGMMPGMPGASNSSFDLPTASYGDNGIGQLDPTSTGFNYPASSHASSSSSSFLADPVDHGFGLFTTPHDLMEFNNFMPQPLASPSLTNGQYTAPLGQTPLQEEFVMFYFDHLHKIQFVFAGDQFTEATHQAIVDDPRGAVTNAISALVDLYSTRRRVAEGLEAPSANPEHSQPMYLRREALFHLQSNKELRGHWIEHDAIAALHLISFSQLSGGAAEWEAPFDILCEWLVQGGLHVSDNPRMLFDGMSPTGQLLVKAVMWFDVFASLSLRKAPRFTGLWKRLLCDTTGYWPQGMGMASLTGCPDEAMLGIVEVSELAQWKAVQQHNGTLSYRELIRRGDDIEQRLRQYRAVSNVGSQEPLGISVRPTVAETGDAVPSDVVRALVADMYRESVVLYLHTVLSDSNPGVPEITAAVDTIIHLLSQLPRSDVDRALVFPICLAACLTNDSNQRDFLKHRFQVLEESVGNLMQARRLMEEVWQKRDVSGNPVNFRDVIFERRLNLLLI
ncbi:fungal-specific transcription factor domain-containing protein [Crucibulum laeve]|uniref:Fungal-specific transcription factor domain-containing protein n=1 Tax=Crucibulum laeve TaxID=68775 RepID=A0A5C3LKD6_9AGAR|nr:fungal-specific transcription factor domain-containing protein [Crucibulum laeve]